MVRRAMPAGFASGARAPRVSPKNRKQAGAAFAKRKTALNRAVSRGEIDCYCGGTSAWDGTG
ncbi:hypothetical protein PBS_61070 [Paraburkholderia sp. 2C]